jgi:VIT1/CCC1 family predicted Fe2+/Mn2+ transporter
MENKIEENKTAKKQLALEPHFTSSDTVRDVIIGMSDGLTVPFALAAGLSGAVSQTDIIVIAGLAEIAAGCISMGLGGFLAAQNDSEHYYSEQKREYKEVEVVPEMEEKEVVDIFKTYGLNDAHIAPIMADFKKNPDNWVAFMMQNELHLEKPDKARAKKSGATIALSYLFSGFIPLSSYIFIKNSHEALFISAVVTLLALVIFGYVKAKLIGNNPWKSALQTVLIGGVAAGAAYLLAKWIS